jgi:hypothetical protein
VHYSSPNFFFVGAARCGTSSLANYLGQHPQIGFSLQKEPNYFIFCDRDIHSLPGPAASQVLYEELYKHSVCDQDAYQQLFVPIQDRKARGEGSVRYLYWPHIPDRIAKAVPDAKIIIMLRNPVDRLWSHYAMMKARYHLEPATLEDAIRLEPQRIRDGWGYDWHYVAVGRYLEQVRRYLETFGKNKVRIYFFEDFNQSPHKICEDIFSFLGVDPGFRPDLSQREMVGRWLRAFWLDKVFFYPHAGRRPLEKLLGTWLFCKLRGASSKLNRIPLPPLDADRKAHLRELFADEFPALQTLLGREITW